MGLAASQARLLTITARKADCEFQSMSLSHQKLSLSRDMEKVSSDYQNSLNTTKLMYDYQGSGESNINLTYGLLMTPSVYNDYYPKLVTDAQNRVMLNSSYAAAARAAGIPAEGLNGTPSSDVRNKFVEALANQGVITATSAATIVGTNYSNTLGLGKTTSTTAVTTDYTYQQFMDVIKTNTDSTSTAGVTLGVGGVVNGAGNVFENERFYRVTDGNVENTELGSSAGTGGSVTLYDLLSGNSQYYLSILSKKGGELPIYGADYLQNKIAGDGGILDWMMDQFSSVLGGIAANDTALQYAYNAVYDMIVPNTHLQDWHNGVNGDTSYKDHLDQKKSKLEEWAQPENSQLKQWMDEIGEGEITQNHRSHDDSKMQRSQNYMGFTYTADKNASGFFYSKTHKDRNDKSQVSINLNNIAQAFLTAYVQYMQGIGESQYSFQKGDKSQCNLYDGTDKNFKFTVYAGSETEDDSTQLISNFYDSMFNMICMNGWTENDKIDDADYMSEMMKNGMAFISSISDDGYYYQGNYSTDKCILEVTDTEAIARAEAKYNTEKTKIENKEDTIDLKMKNLDTEISSLTTEYDTTKQVISKAIEKSFKRYEA